MRVGNVMLRLPRLQDFIKELNEGLISIPFMEVSSKDDMVFMECEKESELSPVRVFKAFIGNQNFALYFWPYYQSALPILTKVWKPYDRHESELLGTFCT